MIIIIISTWVGSFVVRIMTVPQYLHADGILGCTPGFVWAKSVFFFLKKEMRMRVKRAWIAIALVLACASLALANKEVIRFCTFARGSAHLSLTHSLTLSHTHTCTYTPPPAPLLQEGMAAEPGQSELRR